MIVHVVLFTPRPDLTPGQRDSFARALEHAVSAITSIRRYRIGRRIRMSTAYDDAMTEDFAFVGVFEFDDRAGLEHYLAHPAHAELGRLFYTCSARALAYDYDAIDHDPAGALQAWFTNDVAFSQ